MYRPCNYCGEFVPVGTKCLCYFATLSRYMDSSGSISSEKVAALIKAVKEDAVCNAKEDEREDQIVSIFEQHGVDDPEVRNTVRNLLAEMLSCFKKV